MSYILRRGAFSYCIVVDLSTSKLGQLQLHPASTGAAEALLRFASTTVGRKLEENTCLALLRESASTGMALSLRLRNENSFLHMPIRVIDVCQRCHVRR